MFAADAGTSSSPSGYGDQTAKPDENPRCWKCGAKLAEYVGRPWAIRCRRCKSLTKSS